MIGFLDIEATGLDKDKGSILEVGLILTTDDLRPIRKYEIVVKPMFGYMDMEPIVLDMHTKNGLLAECLSVGFRRYEAEERLVQFMESQLIQKPELKGQIQMAGNSIYFDKAWLREHMPRFERFFHRRVIDISTLNEIAKRVAPKVFERRPRADDNHRAMSDAENSLDTIRYYLDEGFFTPHRDEWSE